MCRVALYFRGKIGSTRQVGGNHAAAHVAGAPSPEMDQEGASSSPKEHTEALLGPTTFSIYSGRPTRAGTMIHGVLAHPRMSQAKKTFPRKLTEGVPIY